MARKPFPIDINNCGFVDPQLQLGAALANKHLRDFCSALDMGADPSLYDDKHTSVYEKALMSYGCSVFVEECIKRGCSPNQLNTKLNKFAINFAADSRDPHILRILLGYSGLDVDHLYAGLTPLNTLAKNLSADNQSDVIACIKLLLSYGASPNQPDEREMTPLHYIVKNRKISEQTRLELTELFLTLPELDLDSYRDGELREILHDKYPEMWLPKQKANDSTVTLESLLSLIRSRDETKFLEQFETYRLQSSEKDSAEKTAQDLSQLLLESVKRGAHTAFSTLLKHGADINATYDGNTPIQIATIWGNWRALEELLAQEDLKIRRNDHLLITAISYLDKESFYDFCNYRKCFNLLLDSHHIDVNETDESGSTALHYAVKYRNRTAIQELLNRGAYIGMRSAFCDLPIDGIHPELLEEHFDNCISAEGKASDTDFKILINFKNLIPPSALKNQTQKITAQNFCEEMPPIAFIAESKEHRHLLQHPLITSFLFLKWHRLSVIFYINFLLYTFFAISIITHTILKFRESEHKAITALFGLFSWIGIVYLIVREFVQIIISPIKYFRSPINWMEMALIVLSVMTCIEPSYDRETQRVLAVFTILLVALDLCLLVGSLPILSISTHMLMLRAVSKSFIKSFALYSIFVITFSLCFYILFGKPEVVDGTNAAGQDEGGELNKFSNPFLAVIKTIVMLTGEFDAGDIGFDTLYSYLVFLIFVVFMSIVLFNLLNGLAVSDTQAIKQQAELNGSICRTNLLSRYEHVLTGRSGRASFIIKHEPFRSISRRLMNVYANYIVGSQIGILSNDNNKVLVAVAKPNELELTDIVVSSNGKRNSTTKFLPNDEPATQKKLLDPPITLLPCCCSSITGKCSEMDKRTVNLALAVLERKSMAQHQKRRMQSTEQRLHNIEQTLEKISAMLNDLKMRK